MARIISKTEITLTRVVDIVSNMRYYKLESSTSTAPSKPTENPPSDWSTTEPSYTSGSTNTLYFCDLSVFSDGTFSYSTVSKSSIFCNKIFYEMFEYPLNFKVYYGKCFFKLVKDSLIIRNALCRFLL